MSRQLNLLLALALAVGDVGARAQHVDLDALFGPYLSGGTEIASAADEDFSTVVGHRWSAWEVPEWIGAIKPQTESDLQEIVQIASSNNLSFLATNGGHGTGLNYGTIAGLDINLANFNSVSIDVAENQITVGAGVKIGSIVDPLYEAGRAIPHGNSKCVGVIGATIGAGIGLGTGLYGLGIDAMHSVRLVTAAGEVVTASREQNSDLFWAIRGAGANFGIITAATFNTYDQANDGNAVVSTFVYEASANRSVFDELQTLDEGLPGELSLQVTLSYNHTTETPLVTATQYFFGPLDNAQPHIDAGDRLGPISRTVSVVTEPELYANTDSACASGNIISGSTLGLGRTDPTTMQDVFTELVDFSQQHPGYLGQSVFQRYSNRVTLETPCSETAFPWRDIKTFWLHQNIYTDPSLEDATTELSLSLRRQLQATSGFESPHIYVNYAYGDEGPEGWWSEANLPELRRLKHAWDPDNLFGKGNPIV